MRVIGRVTIGALVLTLMLLSWSPLLAQPARTARLVAPTQGVVLVATDAAHVPLRPLLVDSVYFFVR